MPTNRSASQSVLRAAAYICERGGWELTHLEIHKLLYLANMYHLAYFGKPIIDRKFEAWIYGPVQPGLYDELKHYGPDIVVGFSVNAEERVGDGTQKDILDYVFDTYGNRKLGELIKLTHRDGGGWSKNWTPGNTFHGRKITDDDIREEFELLTGESCNA